MADLQRASDELVAYAIAARADWSARDVRAAIADMTSRGIAWQTIHLSITRIMCGHASTPRDAAPSRQWRGEPVTGPRVHELADACRAELAETNRGEK